MQARLASTASVALVLLSAGSVQAGIDLSGSFDFPEFWQPLTAGGGFGFQASSGGNPGGYMQLSAVLSGPPPFQGGAGAFRPQPYFGFQLSGLTHVMIDAEVRFDSGLSGGTLVPIVYQTGSIFAPAVGGEAIFSTRFERTPTRAYALADFVSFYPRFPGSLPLNPNGPMQFGFMVRLQSDVLGPFNGDYSVDNLRLWVVPSPGAAASLGVALGLLAGRRRR